MLGIECVDPSDLVTRPLMLLTLAIHLVLDVTCSMKTSQPHLWLLPLLPWNNLFKDQTSISKQSTHFVQQELPPTTSSQCRSKCLLTIHLEPLQRWSEIKTHARRHRRALMATMRAPRGLMITSRTMSSKLALVT